MCFIQYIDTIGIWRHSTSTLLGDLSIASSCYLRFFPLYLSCCARPYHFSKCVQTSSFLAIVFLEVILERLAHTSRTCPRTSFPLERRVLHVGPASTSVPYGNLHNRLSSQLLRWLHCWLKAKSSSMTRVTRSYGYTDT